MKKRLTLFLIALMMVLSIFSTSAVAFADDDTVVNVTIAVKGELQLVQEPVTVTDEDGDGSLTIGDALTIVHQEYGKDFVTDAGFITKLWGVETGGSCMYYLDNKAAMNALAETVANGQSICIYVMKDGIGWSDMYSFFDKTNVNTTVNKDITITLNYQYFDASWNTIEYVYEGATIKDQNGNVLGTTDAKGQVTFKLANVGEYIIHPEGKDGNILFPAPCKVTVSPAEVAPGPVVNKPDVPDQDNNESPKTGDESNIGLLALALLAAGTTGVFVKKRHN